MSATTIAIVAVVIWLVAMAGSWCLRWMNALSAIFVAGVIAIGIAVSWQRVEQHRAQKDAETGFYNRPNPAPPAAPPPDPIRSGT